MDQIKIGKFIAQCRKEKNMTQNELAEKINMTDRAISKWETGNGMPDSSVMLELCNELGITVNELLNGEKQKSQNLEKESTDMILELLNENEMKNKSLMLGVWTILIFTSILYAIILILLLLGFKESKNFNTLIIISTIVFLLANFIGLKLEVNAGYYECKNCHHKFKPSYKEMFWAMHLGTKRYLKCPKCQKYSWSTKTLKK